MSFATGTDADSDMDLQDAESPEVWGYHGDGIERFETAMSLARSASCAKIAEAESPCSMLGAEVEFASPVKRASSAFEFASPAGNVSSPGLERAVSAVEFDSGEASYLSMEHGLCNPQSDRRESVASAHSITSLRFMRSGANLQQSQAFAPHPDRRDSLASVGSITSLRHMRSGTSLQHSQVMTPKGQCDDAFASMLMAASPCRVSTASQARSGFGSPARRRAPESLGSCISDLGVSSAFPSDVQHLLSPRGETQQAEIVESTSSRQPQASEQDDLDLSPGRRRWDGSLALSPGRDSSVGSVTSVTSLRLMKSLHPTHRSEIPETPISHHDSQDFVSLLFAEESPSRVRSPTSSSCGSPAHTHFRRSGMSEHRGSASFLSDIQHMLSPRKPSPKKVSPKKGQGTSPGRPLPPVDETQEVVHDLSATPRLQRARESHPLLFSLMTPATPRMLDAPHFPMMTPASPEIQDTPQSACVEPRRLSMQQRCLDLQLEQCEAERDSLKQALRQAQDELQQEQLQRAAAENMLEESQRESRQQQQQFCESQRLLALRQEQRLVEGQRILQQELKQEKQELLDERKALEAEWLRFDLERENMEEDRRNFLLHHVRDADAELMRRERDLDEIRDGLNQLRAQLQGGQQQLAADQAELASAARNLDELKRQLTEREERVIAREREHAETMDRASQTPVFRSRAAGRTWCYRLCSWIPKSMLIHALIWMTLYLSPRCPQLMSYFEAQGIAATWSGSGITSVFRQLCAPYAVQSKCPKCLVQAPRMEQNTSGLDLAAVCASYAPVAWPSDHPRACESKTTVSQVAEEPGNRVYASSVALASGAAIATYVASPL